MSMHKLPLSAVLAFAAIAAAAPALAQDSGPLLAGAPVAGGQAPNGYFSAPGYFGQARSLGMGQAVSAQAIADAPRPGPVEGPTPSKECYAKVRIKAQYSPAQIVSHYVWRLSAGPPGAPGPIWCLVPETTTSGPSLISPERFDWIRVNCETGAAPQFAPQPVIQPPLIAPPAPVFVEAEGRYDRRTPPGALMSAPPLYPTAGYPAPIYPARPAPQPCCGNGARADTTILGTGVVTWPGKSY